MRQHTLLNELLAAVAPAAILAVAIGCARQTLAADAPGLKIGEKAPAFSLQDQNGEERSLEQLLEKGKVAVVFYRSADW